MKNNNTIIFVLFALIASLVASSAVSSPFVSVPAHVKSIYAASDNNNDASGTEDKSTKGDSGDAGGTGTKGEDTGTKGEDTGTKGEDTGTKGEDTGTKGEDTGTKGEDTGTTRQSPDVNKPCPVSEQIRNPDTGLCESVTVEGPANNGTTVPGVTVPPANNGVTVPPANNGVTVPPANNGVTVPPANNGVTVPPANNGVTEPSGTVPPGLSVSGNCNAVALSDATNKSSSASSAAVTCNNSVVNKYIYQQHLTQTLPQIQSAIANKGPIILSDNMKLGQAQVIGTNNIIVVGDFSPFRIVGGHISANLPKGNNIQIVVGEISTTGVLSKAVPLPLVKARDLTTHDALYTTSLGNIIQGRDIVNGNTVTINSPNIIMLYNIGTMVTFSGSNSIAYTAIIA
jgi:hypothetical protein